MRKAQEQGKRLPIVYSERHNFDIGAHVFPARKYAAIVERLEREGIVRRTEMITPGPATDEELLLAHTPEYVRKLKTNTLSQVERWRMEIPFSAEILEAFRIAVGGTIRAAEEALDAGISVHIGGGFHHAFADHGEGFCVLNDIAVAARRLVRDKRVGRFMVIDCDLHQGNGTADIFKSDRHAFTFSIHQQDNYPADKASSSLDVGLEDGASDAEYLAALSVVGEIMDADAPGIVFYVAGADPYKHDMLGGLALTIDGLRARDSLVMREARRRSIPVATVLAGGYAARFSDTVLIHTNTIEEAMQIQEGGRTTQ